MKTWCYQWRTCSLLVGSGNNVIHILRRTRQGTTIRIRPWHIRTMIRSIQHITRWRRTLFFPAAPIPSSQPVLSRYSLYPLAGDAAAIGARLPVYFSVLKKKEKP